MTDSEQLASVEERAGKTCAIAAISTLTALVELGTYAMEATPSVVEIARRRLLGVIGHYRSCYVSDAGTDHARYPDKVSEWLESVRQRLEVQRVGLTWSFGAKEDDVTIHTNPAYRGIPPTFSVVLALSTLEGTPDSDKSYGPIDIHVSGPPRSGTSRAQLIVTKALHDAGYTVRCTGGFGGRGAKPPEKYFGSAWHDFNPGKTEHCAVTVSAYRD